MFHSPYMVNIQLSSVVVLTVFCHLWNVCVCINEQHLSLSSLSRFVCVCVVLRVRTSSRWSKPAVRRCAPPNRTCAPTTSVSLARCHATSSSPTSTATGSPSSPRTRCSSRRTRTPRSRRPQNPSSRLPPSVLTCTPVPSSPSPSFFLTLFTGPFICERLSVCVCVCDFEHA